MHTANILQGLWASRINVPPDLIQSLRGTETHTRNDYLGRVVFEFFQNAVDKAKHRIDIALQPSAAIDGTHCLLVANDGESVTIDGLSVPESVQFPLESGGMGEVVSRFGAGLPSDFQALCNIHNSNKQAGQSIGNKGVGFKSAWEFAKQVTVASTLPDGQRYAFRFHQKLDADRVLDDASFWPGLDARLRQSAAAVLQRAKGLPSFYFPEYVADAQACFAGREWASTVVILEGIDAPGQLRLIDRIAEFRQAPLFFINQLRGQVGHKLARAIEVTTDVAGQTCLQSTAVPPGWTVIDEALLADIWPTEVDALRSAARSLNFAIAQPSLALAFPPERWSDSGVVEDAPNPSRFFCYLPTYVDCGFGVQIHADFMLDMSRKNIEVAQNPYNNALVHLAGRLLGRALRTLPALHQRVDVMGFLLPGKADNPAVDELRRGLACELHLPVGEDTAEVGTLTAFLTAIFPVAQPAWPELRYTQTLDFFRYWCARDYGEHRSAHSARIAPFINIFREHQTCILPERVESGVVCVALPLPPVDAGERLRDGRGIFWRRKTDDTLTAESGGISLAATGVNGLAVTEWDKLTDADQSLLGLLNFNLGEIAQRLRIRIEAEVNGRAVVQAETLSFQPDAVLRFVASLLLRAAQAVVDRIQPLAYLATPNGNADNLSKMLLPIVGDGWRVGREVIWPDVLPGLDLLPGPDGAGVSVLDIERFQAATGLADTEKVRSLALALGVWPCLPLLQSSDGWRLPFDLAGVHTAAKRTAFYQAFVSAWGHWFQAAPAVAGQIAQVLRQTNSPWLPLASQYNTPENHCACPVEVLLVHERDRTHLSFLLKKVAQDDIERAALQAIGVVAAADATIEKLLSLLAFMVKANPGDEVLRGRYRSLVLELGSRDWTQFGDLAHEKLKLLPLLVSERNTRHWLPADQAKDTWFVPRTAQHLRSEFRNECIFLEFDPDTKLVQQLLGVREFAPKLQLGCGEPTAPNATLPAECQETRQRLQNDCLADLILIAESATVGGGVRTRESVELEWQHLMIRRGERVWLQATLDGRQHFIGAAVDRRDVLLNASGGQLEIWHDVPLDELDTSLHLFAEPLANGVFGNRLLTDAFAAYLGAGARRKSWLADRYGITEDERQATQRYLASRFLAGEALEKLLQVICALPEWPAPGVGLDALKARWGDTSFYIENQLALDAARLRQRIPSALVDRCPLLDPSAINQRCWQQSMDEKLLHLALLTDFLDRGRVAQLAASQALEAFRALPAEVSRFDFDPLAVQRLRIQSHTGLDLAYLDWCQAQRKSLNWLSAERILAGDIADESVLVAPVNAATMTVRTITSVRQTGTRRVKQTTQAQREQENQVNHRAGLTAEHQVVLASARNLLASSDRVAQWDEVLRVWAMLAKEFDGLPSLPLDCPGEQDMHALARLLHAAVHVGDGLGFDVIEVGEHPGEVWLSEVKSAAGGRLFLSENERIKALQYETTMPGRWRLKVWLGNGQWASPEITGSVLGALRDIDLRLNGNVQARPQGWEFQLG